jgi:hypothetical protein
VSLHAGPQPDIVAVLRISASISVSDEAILTDFILVRSGLSFHNRHGREAQRKIQQRRLENALRPQERDAGAFEIEAFL